GFQAAQDVRPHKIAERAIRILLPVGEAFDVGGKLLRRAQESGINEIEDRPQIAQSVLNGRAGESNTRLRLELFDRLGLLRGWILDGLRLIKHRQLPRRRCERRYASQKAVTRDD